ncbi:hypothetical protein COR50_22145 [Chitinophaga caeni]|uniref:Aspartyl protease n=1 Tax=Chitinophaga caeni TaxID=2029983 RepID=A0A291R0E9_9BACT|nr:hypothetical protein [Chitinophaga caeni]ATL49655.1 hypothetical protein COR50_22145 [Chitinophaga caeni]
MRKFIYIIGLFSFLTKTSFTQNLIQDTGIKEKHSIPFHVTSYNNIVISAVINHLDTVDLMLHTGSHDVTLIESILPKLKTIKFDGFVDSVKSWGGSNNTSDVSKNNLLTIADLNWDSITIWKDKHSGQKTYGKFGLDLFENKILDFDFDKNLLVIETKLPQELNTYHKFPLFFENGNMYIKAICQTQKGKYENDFLIHSGYGGDILLDDNFVSENELAGQIDITGERKLQDAFGNVLTSKKGILPLFIIGNLQLSNVPVGFFDGAIGRQKISIIGGDVLKRFNWIVDANREFIYLKPNSHFNTNYSSI